MVQNNTSQSKISRWFPWLICALGAVFYTYEYLLRIAPNVMISDLMKSFHIGSASLGHLIGFYYYAYAPAQLLVGLLMDHFGPRRILTVACLICGVGTYLFASTAVYPVAAFGRFLMGFGSAFAFVGVLKLATIWLPPDRFAMVSGLTSALGTIGAFFGENLLEHLVIQMGWRELIMSGASIGILLAIILLLFLRDGTPEAKALDSRDNLDFKTIGRGMISILMNPQIWVVGIIGGLLYLPTSVFAEAWGKAYLEVVHHLTSQEAAFINSLIFLGFTIGGPLNGLLSDVLHSRIKPIQYGGLLATITMSLLLFVPNQSIWLLAIEATLTGIFYSVQVIVFAIGRERSPDWASGSAIAVVNMVVMLGGAIFQPLVGYMLQIGWDQTLVDGIPVYAISDYQRAAYIFPIALILAPILTRFLKRHG